jgi:uridine kinase
MAERRDGIDRRAIIVVTGTQAAGKSTVARLRLGEV